MLRVRQLLVMDINRRVYYVPGHMALFATTIAANSAARATPVTPVTPVESTSAAAALSTGRVPCLSLGRQCTLYHPLLQQAAARSKREHLPLTLRRQGPLGHHHAAQQRQDHRRLHLTVVGEQPLQ